MSKFATFVTVLLLCLATYSLAQGGPCPTATSTTQIITTRSRSLICVVPQVYGPGGLVGSNDNGPLVNTSMGATAHDVDFQNDTFVRFSPLTSEIGTQLSQLPLASPVSGFVFSFNRSLGVITEITQNYGPILSERASTLGRHKLFVGVSYQYFDFDKVDGVSLRSFGAVLRHETAGLPACTDGTPGCTNGLPTFAQDVITTQNRMDLKVHEVAAVAGFGLTSRVDVSVAVPILDVRMSMLSTATIHSFETDPADPNSCYMDPVLMSTGVKGCMHQFSSMTVPGETLLPAQPYPFGQNQAAFSSATSKFGIGDVIFRGKFQAIRGERAGLAFGVDVHAPTGDEMNFLGAGTWGTRPFAAFSYSGRIAPHASVGYQINGNSILAGDVTTNTKSHLANIFTYDAGLDGGINSHLSLSADFLGQSLLNVQKIGQITFVDLGGNSYTTIQSSARVTSNQLSMAVGGKIKPFRKLLISANVLFRVNDEGLHSKPVPLVGLSYSF